MKRTVLAAGLLIGIEGCTFSCTQMGCGQTGVALFLVQDANEAGWRDEQDVVYAFTIEGDDEVHRCEGSPFGGFDCAGALSLERSLYGTGPGSYFEVAHLQLSTFPGPVELVVERASDVVLTQAFDVTEEVSYPNGRQCGPRCETWSGTLDSW